MARDDGRTGLAKGYRAAVRRLPGSELAIRRLMQRSETFRDICEELAEAELALDIVPETLSALSEIRRREFQDLVDRLVVELTTALAESDATTRLAAASRSISN